MRGTRLAARIQAGVQRDKVGLQTELKAFLPWWARIPAKVVLAGVPTKSLHRLGLFHHGDMTTPEYAEAVFDTHLKALQLATGRGPARDFVALELGPGESLFSALLARGAGASKTYLVDNGNFAQRRFQAYAAMASHVNARTARRVDVGGARSADEIVAAFGGIYLTDGLRSLRAIPSSSVDFLWSHAVLHAIRRAEFPETMAEIRRVMRPGGLCSHEVDLRDMLGGGLNHLRFRQDLWESSLFIRAGFYANRLRFSEMLDAFRQSGFEPLSLERKCWEKIPLSRKKLYLDYQALPDAELLTHGFHVVLQAIG